MIILKWEDITDEQLKMLKTNYIYDNMKELCDDMDFSYDDNITGGSERKLLKDRIAYEYAVEKVSR